MNDKEKIENLMAFITNASNNTQVLINKVKDCENLTQVKLEVAEFVINYSKNLQELLTIFDKEEQNGSIEH